MSAIASGVSGQQPVNPATQVAVVDRPESEMEVIGQCVAILNIISLV
jgi:hypothetical protein